MEDSYESLPEGIAILEGPDHRYLLANEAYQKLINRTADQLIGKPHRKVFSKKDPLLIFPLLEAAIATGKRQWVHEIPLFPENEIDQPSYFTISVEPVLLKQNAMAGALLIVLTMEGERAMEVFFDTERKHIEEQQSFLLRLSDVIRSLTHPIDIADAVMREAMGYFKADRCYYCEIDGDTAVIRQDAFRGDLPPVAGIYTMSDYAMFKAMVEYGQPFVVTDVLSTELLDDKLTQLCISLQIRSFINVPVVKNGKPVGMLWLAQAVPRNWTSNELGLAVETAERTWAAMERARAEEKLKESESRFRGLASEAPLFVWETDQNLQTTFLNKTGWNYFNLADDINIDTLSWRKFIHPEDIENMVQVMNHSAQNHQPYSLEMRLKNGVTGEYRWFLDKGVPQYKLDQFIGFVGTSLDIDDSKRAEYLLKENEQALQQKVAVRTRELAEMNTAFENAEVIGKMGNFIWNLETNEMVWSKNMFAIYGVQSDRFIPSTDNVVALVHPEDAARVKQTMIHSLKSKTPLVIDYRILVGGVLKHLIGSSRLKISEKAEPLIFGIVQDFTEMKKKEEQVLSAQNDLRQKNEQLEKLNKELESFAYISSHDMQEPLRKIQTFTSRILDVEKELSLKGQDYFNRIKTSASRMQALIEDLLSFTRIKNIHTMFESAELADIVEEVKSELGERILDRKATIEVCSDCKVRVIPYQFRQLITNLVSNSLKFSRPGVAPVISIKTEIVYREQIKFNTPLPFDAYCHIIFTDNGIGFEQEYSEKIFEVFQRLHDRATYSGTGIGLAIVKKIVENHKGFITASSGPGQGVRFDIYIPHLEAPQLQSSLLA